MSKDWKRTFKCTGCGACCTGSPGAVWVSESEVVAMAAYLSISVEEFSKRYLRSLGGHLSLKELLPNYDCIFLENKQCKIYPVRPEQCKIYPRWPELLASKEAWDEEKKRCEGLDHPEGTELFP